MADETAKAVGQGVFDVFCREMDDALRGLGVKDTAVGKRMRFLAEAYYGRAAAYDAALGGADADALAATLRRTVYGGEGTVAAPALAAYMLASDRALGGDAGRSRHRRRYPLASHPASTSGGSAVKQKPLLSRTIETGSIGDAGVIEHIEATEAERAAIAAGFNLISVDSLAADLDVRRNDAGLIVVDGVLRADVVHTCVVSLEPAPQRIDEPFHVTLAPAGSKEAPPEPKPGAEVMVDPERGPARGGCRSKHRSRRDRARTFQPGARSLSACAGRETPCRTRNRHGRTGPVALRGARGAQGPEVLNRGKDVANPCRGSRSGYGRQSASACSAAAAGHVAWSEWRRT